MKTKLTLLLAILINLNILAANVDTTAPSMPYNAKHCISKVTAENTYYTYNGWELNLRQSEDHEDTKYTDTIISSLNEPFELELIEILGSSYPKQITHCSGGEAMTIEVIAGSLNGEMINVEMECFRTLAPSSGPKPKDDPYYTKPNEYCY